MGMLMTLMAVSEMCRSREMGINLVFNASHNLCPGLLYELHALPRQNRTVAVVAEALWAEVIVCKQPILCQPAVAVQYQLKSARQEANNESDYVKRKHTQSSLHSRHEAKRQTQTALAAVRSEAAQEWTCKKPDILPFTFYLGKLLLRSLYCLP